MQPSRIETDLCRRIRQRGTKCCWGFCVVSPPQAPARPLHCLCLRFDLCHGLIKRSLSWWGQQVALQDRDW